MRFNRQGPKRRRRTRRDFGNGQRQQYPRDWHPKVERDRKRFRVLVREFGV